MSQALDIYLFLLFFISIVLTFISFSFFFNFERKFFYSFTIFLICVLPFYIYVRKRIFSLFIDPFCSAVRGVNNFFKRQYLPEPLKISGAPEIKEFVSHINRLMLELQAYRGFQINKIVDENNKAKTLVDIIPDAALLAGEKNELIYFNERAKILLKLNAALPLPQCVGEAVFSDKISDILSGQEDSKAAEIEADLGNKGIKIYFVIKKKFSIPSLKKEGFALIIRDITKEKKFEAAKDDFFHMITHDMRAPLSTIEGYCEMLFRKTPKTEEGEKYFQKIFYSSRKLKGMIEDILNYRKLKEKKAIISLDYIDPCEIIKSVIDEHTPMASARNINIFSSCAVGKERLYADRSLLERAVSNLVSNAVKFTPSSGNVELSYKRESGFGIFSVKDEGPGIPEDKKNLIFEKYISYDDEKNRGFGLGLALCRLVAEIHGGKIEVKSEIGKGSEFLIYIPDKNKENL